MFTNNTAPFVPAEEDFNEKPIRADDEKKKGFKAFLKDDDEKQQNMVFDEEHFQKFLKEDVESKDESAGFNTLNGKLNG